LLTPAPAIPLEKAMEYIKGGFSFRLKSKNDVWSRGFKEHRVKDARDLANHVHYIEQNPVRAGHQERGL
jgi:REP-associated tyrosine transposase